MPRKISEERTRKEMIDPQLEQAGWYLHVHAKAGVVARAVVELSRDIESLRGRMGDTPQGGDITVRYGGMVGYVGVCNFYIIE